MGTTVRSMTQPCVQSEISDVSWLCAVPTFMIMEFSAEVMLAMGVGEKLRFSFKPMYRFALSVSHQT